MWTESIRTLNPNDTEKCGAEKGKLYAMLCDAETKYEELENSYRQLEADSMKRIGWLDDDLAATVTEKNSFKELVEQQRKLIKEARTEVGNCLAEVRWVNEHPWKHLLRCLRGEEP